MGWWNDNQGYMRDAAGPVPYIHWGPGNSVADYNTQLVDALMQRQGKEEGSLNSLFDIANRGRKAIEDNYEYSGGGANKERLGPPIPDHLKQKSPLDILMQTITGGGPKLTPPPAVGGIPQLPGMDLNDYVNDPNIKNAVSSLIGSQNTPLKGQIAERRKLLNQDIKTLSFLDRAHKKNLKDLNRDVKREAANSGKKQQKIAKNSVANYARETDSAISSDLGQLSDSALAQYNAEASKDVANMDQAHNELADIQRQRTAGTNDFMSDLIASTSLATTEDTAKVQRAAETDIDQYNTQITANNQQAPALIQQYAQQQMQNALSSYSAQMQAWAAQNDAAQQAWQNQNSIAQQGFENKITGAKTAAEIAAASAPESGKGSDPMDILKFVMGAGKNKSFTFNEEGKKSGEVFAPNFNMDDPESARAAIQMMMQAGYTAQQAWSILSGNVSDDNRDNIRREAYFPYLLGN